MIPNKCEMPDLTDLKQLFGGVLLRVFIGEPGLNQKQALYRVHQQVGG